MTSARASGGRQTIAEMQAAMDELDRRIERKRKAEASARRARRSLERERETVGRLLDLASRVDGYDELVAAERSGDKSASKSDDTRRRP